MRKGMLEYCILLLLSRRRAYASDIIKILKQANMIVVEGTLYPLLTRLKNVGAVTYRWEESSQGPPRKYYFITPEGKEALKVLELSWKNIADAITYIESFENNNSTEES